MKKCTLFLSKSKNIARQFMELSVLANFSTSFHEGFYFYHLRDGAQKLCEIA